MTIIIQADNFNPLKFTYYVTLGLTVYVLLLLFCCKNLNVVQNKIIFY